MVEHHWTGLKILLSPLLGHQSTGRVLSSVPTLVSEVAASKGPHQPALLSFNTSGHPARRGSQTRRTLVLENEALWQVKINVGLLKLAPSHSLCSISPDMLDAAACCN